MTNIRFDEPYNLLVLIPPMIVLIALTARGGWNKRKIYFLVVRAVIVSLIVVAMASPNTLSSKDVLGELPPITLLVDSSASLGLFETGNISKTLLRDLTSISGNLTGQKNVNLEYFSPNRTEIGDALYRTSMKYSGNNLIVLISDGNNNYGREPVSVAGAIGRANTTVFSITPPKIGDDIIISDIIGARSIPVNSEYDLIIEIEKTSDKRVVYDLEIITDGNRIYSERVRQDSTTREVSLVIEFSDIGIHEIEARIIPVGGDHFEENNRYLKVVEVVEKPSILIVSDNEGSPLTEILDKIYEVDLSKTINANFDGYTTVFLDNINASLISKSDVLKLKNYVLEGNGLVVVGGDKSYEYGNYNNSYLESLLPVKSVEKPIERRRSVAVVFLIDVSESTEYGKGGTAKIDREKSLAISMVRDLAMNDSVGVIAFNKVPFLIENIDKLAKNRELIEDKIMRLRFGGGTDMVQALTMAESLLGDYPANKNIIILSDGIIPGGRFKATRDVMSAMSERGIRIHTVGVGFDTDVNIMSQLAHAGGGLFFKPEQHQRLKIEFGRPLEEKVEGYTPVQIHDEHHFITRNTNLDGVGIKDFNKVYEKSIARVLVSTKGGQPILTVWWFGLGRVASLTTDNGGLWGTSLYSVEKGKLITAITNWAIGNLEKGKDVLIIAQDMNLGDDAIIRVQSGEKPKLISKHEFETPSVSLKQEGVDSFISTFKPTMTGFYALRATTDEGSDSSSVAVNYPREYRALGINTNVLSRVAGATGGNYYTSGETSELKMDILNYAKRMSTSRIIEKKQLWMYFALSALALFFLDVVVRRIRNIIRLKGT